MTLPQTLPGAHRGHQQRIQHRQSAHVCMAGQASSRARGAAAPRAAQQPRRAAPSSAAPPMCGAPAAHWQPLGRGPRPRGHHQPRAADPAPAAAAAAAAEPGRQREGGGARGAGGAGPQGFVLEAPEVQRLLRERGCSMDVLLLSLLEPAARLARPPISNYHVGAVGLAPSGRVYLGANLEFPGAPLSQSVHAEQFLMASLLLAREAGLDTLAISAAPCGHCRQFYSELACADSVRFLFGSHDAPHEAEEYTLADLLPARFGPIDLIEPGSAPLLLEPQANRLAWAPPAARRLEERAGEAPFARAAAAALEAAKRSYSPYTRCPAGVALVARGGRVFSGGYTENAAHNPGLAPLQAAVVGAIIGGLGPYSEIEEVVVAELGAGLVRHGGVAKTVARAATGNAMLPVTVLHTQWTE
ncbi:MAG: cytidine and deoxycytidylate deaminase zinc-binding region-domain-containing protein [Monoraphidium minutum]|nr:MAG: cytidine and deoxycytidylate deaminase zinc-binding region-domain-containing protein [Monoraphidium minutum]